MFPENIMIITKEKFIANSKKLPVRENMSIFTEERTIIGNKGTLNVTQAIKPLSN